MAYKFSQGKTKNMTNFRNFLEDKKADTFLEDADIELSQTSGANDTITITLGNGEVKLIADASQQVNQIMKYTGKYAVFTMNSCSSYGASEQYITLITSVMLGKNGLLLEYNGSYASSTPGTMTKYPIMLTVDSNGDLAVVAYTGAAITNSVYETFHVYSYNSPSASTTYVYPNYSATQTSLAQIVPYTDDTSINLPYAYAAIHTQIGGEGLTEVVMDGKHYITNGFWYVME